MGLRPHPSPKKGDTDMDGNTLPESPYSLNTHFVDRRGFCVQITLRGDDGGDVIKRFDAMLDWLLEHGALPTDRYGNPTGRPAEQPAANGNGNGHDASWCPIHSVEMKLFQKDGRSWYSHKTDDGWCNGKPKKQ